MSTSPLRDVIDFTARLFGLSGKEAALKLAEDFSVRYDAKGHDPPRRRPVKRKISEELRYRQAEQKCFRVLCDYLHLLERWEKKYAPQTPEEAWNPLFVVLDLFVCYFGKIRGCRSCQANTCGQTGKKDH